jgi:predicted RNase H-like HicB family nuclease
MEPTYSYTVFYESDPDGGYVASVPALPGCHTQGSTIEQAEERIREAILVYVDSLLAHVIDTSGV